MRSDKGGTPSVQTRMPVTAPGHQPVANAPLDTGTVAAERAAYEGCMYMSILVPLDGAALTALAARLTTTTGLEADLIALASHAHTSLSELALAAPVSAVPPTR